MTIRLNGQVRQSRELPQIALAIQRQGHLSSQGRGTKQSSGKFASVDPLILFPSLVSESPHVSTRQYSRIVGYWVASIGLDPAAYGTHSLRRMNATLIYRRTRNLRAVQLLLGHTKLDYLPPRVMSPVAPFREDMNGCGTRDIVGGSTGS
jgi:integrase